MSHSVYCSSSCLSHTHWKESKSTRCDCCKCKGMFTSKRLLLPPVLMLHLTIDNFSLIMLAVPAAAQGLHAEVSLFSFGIEPVEVQH